MLSNKKQATDWYFTVNDFTQSGHYAEINYLETKVKTIGEKLYKAVNSD